MASVAAIVPNFNHARFLEPRLDSIDAQSHPCDDIVLLDDASTDGSNLILEAWASRRNLAVHFNRVNSGSPFKQWNKGVKLANSEYIWIAESDDCADASLLERLLIPLEADRRIGISYCQSLRIDATGAAVGDCRSWTDDLDVNRWKNDFVNGGRDECSRFFGYKSPIFNASAVVFRRSAFLDAGGVDETFLQSADWLLWIKMLLRVDIAFTSAPLNSFRTHEASVTRTTYKSGRRFREDYQVMRYLRDQKILTASQMERALDAKLSSWLYPWLLGHAPISWKGLQEVYRAGKMVDARLKMRAFSIVCRYLLHSAPLLDPMRRFVKRFCRMGS